jgi:hypothetical protein
MVMFESVTGIGLRADALIRSYFSFSEGQLDAATDTANSPKQLIEVRGLANTVQAYADQARALMALPEFATLDPKVQRDITAIAEESEAAVVEIKSETDPDNKWNTLTSRQKDDVMQRVLADSASVASIRARLKHQKRGQAPTPPPTPPADLKPPKK